MFPRCPSKKEQVQGAFQLKTDAARIVKCEWWPRELTLNALRELSRRNFVVECQQPPFRLAKFIAEQDANCCWLKPRLPDTPRPFEADCGINVMLDPAEFDDLPPGAYGS